MNASSCDLRAVPTAYGGITFRSKSEAVFARAMDLAKRDFLLLWSYEPNEYRTADGWLFDFLLVMGTEDHRIGLFCIEYKPSEPTTAYLNRIRVSFTSRCMPGTLVITYGSPFDKESPTGTLELRDGNYRRLERALFWEYWDEALNYRFDLK